VKGEAIRQVSDILFWEVAGNYEGVLENERLEVLRDFRIPPRSS
jgi:hypothetical protein